VLVSSDVDHASVYMFEIDEDSRLGREVMEGGGRYHAGAVPGDDLIADLYLEAVEVLNDNGLAQYEISNFSRPGSESVHNMKYWLRRPYLGFGLDSHSMLRGVDGGVVRFQSADDLDIFLGGCSLADVRSISRQEELEEAWFLGLRLNAGVSLAGLEREFGDLEVCAHDGLIDELERDGMALVDEGRIRLTGRGRLLSNEVFARFLTQDRPSSLDLVLVD
jgi:oxygen-independent coproporphyrinogen-3 oxidase